MRTIRLICVSLGLLFSASIMAFDIAGVGALNVTSPALSTGGSPTVLDTKYGVGFGVTAGVYSIFPGFTVETGLLSVPRKFADSSNPTDVRNLKMWEIPVLVRFDLLPVIAAGAGLYFATASGDIVKTNETGLIPETTETYETNNLSKTDIGLVISASVALPILPFVKLLVDLRYIQGLKNLSTATDGNFKLKDIQVLAGVRVSI